jgi:hypothetical protein
VSNTYSLNEHGEVVPYVCGRKANDTRLYREPTEFELQLLEQIEELEQNNKIDLLKAFEPYGCNKESCINCDYLDENGLCLYQFACDAINQKINSDNDYDNKYKRVIK